MTNQNRPDWRMHFHIMPPDGWLNDPNGLCQFKGVYHIFFQYAPNEPGPDGRPARTWGHYAGKDLTHLTFEGVPFWPVDPIDHNGCYSGSALTEEDEVLFYYTGNVKEEGDHDFTYTGRGANEIIVKYDGKTFGEKILIMTNQDYPEDCTCHVRDPKVWKENDVYYMVLGARVNGGEKDIRTDYGEVLVYKSTDKVHWTYFKSFNTDERFGYMWECPDYFKLEGQNFLSICPQGLRSMQYRFQNNHQAGYFPVSGGEIEEEQKVSVSEFREWDYGFDFYAPQTFADESGRRILFGWVGLPDKPYGNAADRLPSYWENCLTLPRVLTRKGNVILQNPAEEIDALRYAPQNIPSNGSFTAENGSADIEIRFDEDREFDVEITAGLYLSYKNHILRLNLDAVSGEGRHMRSAVIDSVRNVRIVLDVSIVEIYVNDGETVMTSRFYPEYSHKDDSLNVFFDCPGAQITAYQMHSTEE